MLTYFKRLLTDEGAFIGAVRALLGALAVLATKGSMLTDGAVSPKTSAIIGAVSMAAALLMRSNATTTTPPK